MSNDNRSVHEEGPITCVRGIIARCKNGEVQILLMKILDGEFDAQALEAPGGAVEGNENYREALARELEQETGLTENDWSVVQGFVPVDDFIIPDGKCQGRRYRSFFQLLLVPETVVVEVSEEHSGHKWVPYGRVFDEKLSPRSLNGLNKLSPAIETL